MAAPVITGFTREGAPGAKGWIAGNNFNTAAVTAVTIGGISATFAINSDEQIAFVVPSGAVTGTIAVTNPTSTVTSTQTFTVRRNRAHLRVLVNDAPSGANVQNAKVYIFAYQTGAANGSGTPTGTAVTMYTSPTGSTTTTNPLTTNSQGEVEVWVDAPGPYDTVITSNGGAAYVSGSPTSLLSGANVLDVEEAHPAETRAHPQVKHPPAEAWLSVDGDDSDTNRGSYDRPYASLDQIYQDYLGTTAAGFSSSGYSTITNINNVVQLVIRVRPGPQQDFPALPFSGATSFGGQAFYTGTSTIALPSEWRIIGTGASAREGNYGVLFYGNVAAGPVFRIGVPSGAGNLPSGEGLHLERLAITNVAADGRGLDVANQAQRIKLHDVHFYGCGGTGMQVTRNTNDLDTYEQCMFMNNGQGAGGGYGVVITADGNNTAPNAQHFVSCRFASNRTGQIYSAGIDVTNGLAVSTFHNCFVGNVGSNAIAGTDRRASVVLLGSRVYRFSECYIELGGGAAAYYPAFWIDSHSATTGEEGWAKNIVITNNRFHGWSNADLDATFLASIGRHVHVARGSGVKVRDNVHQVSSVNATNPLVWFDTTNSRFCEAVIEDVYDEGQTPKACGTSGASFVNLGHPSNRATLYDKDAN